MVGSRQRHAIRTDPNRQIHGIARSALPLNSIRYPGSQSNRVLLQFWAHGFPEMNPMCCVQFYTSLLVSPAGRNFSRQEGKVGRSRISSHRPSRRIRLRAWQQVYYRGPRVMVPLTLRRVLDVRIISSNSPVGRDKVKLKVTGSRALAIDSESELHKKTTTVLRQLNKRSAPFFLLPRCVPIHVHP